MRYPIIFGIAATVALVQVHPTFAKSSVEVDRAIKLNPNDAEAYYNRGVARYTSGDKGGAITDYDRAIKLNPNDANAYYNRGLAWSGLGDKRGAIADLQTAIVLMTVPLRKI